GLSEVAAAALQKFWRSWNGCADPSGPGDAWRAFWRHRETFEAHARAWAIQLANTRDMTSRLAQLCRDRLK
ncbi:MAG: elongation factor P maturation arginine rhamnosyltransferase EarP, partial [Betaproteobacteria bacterium]|nr:elongation factor P maturation arginine rhamnosyltransferase EarP [Betaproteobacteria bacterium]